MLLSPIGLAAVTELSVRSVVGVMMGAWWLGTAYSEVLAALLGKLSAVAPSMGGPDGGPIVIADALAKYDALFVYSAKIGIGRSEERSVGKECFSTCKSRWAPEQ